MSYSEKYQIEKQTNYDKAENIEEAYHEACKVYAQDDKAAIRKALKMQNSGVAKKIQSEDLENLETVILQKTN